MRCQNCARVLIEIRMRVGESVVTFRRCNPCDSQAWATADGTVGLDRVLELARGA